jgi:hypothetical protein
MLARLLWVGVALGACGTPIVGRADEPGTLPPPRPVPQGESESLPQPRPLPDAGPVYGPPVMETRPAYPVRRNPYDVWQYYGVGHQGFFRPRVVYSPYGSYYLYNGQPYPWAPVHGLDFMTYIVD